MKALAPKLTWMLALASILLVSFACTAYDLADESRIDPGSAVELPPDFPTEAEAGGRRYPEWPNGSTLVKVTFSVIFILNRVPAVKGVL